MSTYQNIQSAAFWLDKNKSNIHREGKTQILHLLQTLIEQNYFQRDIKYYKPTHGIAMGSPISGTLAEIFLQLIEEHNVKHWIANGDLFYYRRYVDDIFIIIDTRNTDGNIIRNRMNSINTNLKF